MATTINQGSEKFCLENAKYTFSKLVKIFWQTSLCTHIVASCLLASYFVVHN